MRFAIDAQLPAMLCRWLEERGHLAEAVGEVFGGETPDRDVAAYAAEHGCVLMSKDEDFITRHPPITYQLVWLRIGNAGNRSLIDRLGPRCDAIMVAIEQGERFVEAR